MRLVVLFLAHKKSNTKGMKREVSYISINGPVVVLKLAEVLLWSLHLVDLQQQLVVF